MTRRLLIAGLFVFIVTDAAPAFWVGVHGEITQTAFVRGAKFRGKDFLPFAVAEISDANRAMDTGDCRFAPRDGNVWVKPAMPCDFGFEEGQALLRSSRGVAREHFDSEQIQEGHERILNVRRQIIDAILRMQYIEARRLLGSALHSLQDFYAHTNWVELGKVLPEPRLAVEGPGFTRGQPQLASPTESTCVMGQVSVLLEEVTGPFVAFEKDIVYPTADRARLTSGYFPVPVLAARPTETQKCAHGTIVPKNAKTGERLTTADGTPISVLRGLHKDTPLVDRLFPKATGPLDIPPWLNGGALNELKRHAAAKEAAIAHSTQFLDKLLGAPELKDHPELVLAFMGYTQVVELRGDGTFVAAGYKKQKYHTHLLDLTDWESGELVILTRLGRGASSASFNLFYEGAVPAENADPVGNLAHAWDIRPGATVTMRFVFNRPVRLVFTASPNWFSNPPAANDYSFEAYVERGVRRVAK